MNVVALLGDSLFAEAAFARFMGPGDSWLGAARVGGIEQSPSASWTDGSRWRFASKLPVR